MKKMTFIAALLVVASLAGGVSVAHAEQSSSSLLSDSHLDRIRANCGNAQQTLNQLHVNDARLYVNRNQAYFSISDKLMARLNSRLALNRLDGSSLVTSAASFDKSLNDFRTAYRQYETHLALILRIDCQKQPGSFYDAVVKAQGLRADVALKVQDLHRYINEYDQSFGTFKAGFLAPQKEKDTPS